MSRNFELLQNIGKEQNIFEQTAEVLIAPAPQEVVAELPVEPVAAVLSLNEHELEEVNKLVQRLFLMPGAESARAVVFSSTEPGNGCSWMVSRVAETLAGQTRASVCLVDANLRNPGQHEAFGIENHHGLSDALRFPDPVGHFVKNLARPNLYLMSCGAPVENGASLVSSDRMRVRIGELRNAFDYVLIDTAATSVCNDSVVLGAACDGVVLVLKANSSRRESVKRAVSEMQAAKARVLGAVLNQRTFPIPDAIYNKL